MRRLFLFLLIVPLIGVVQSCADQRTETRDISVLFIGNSYTFQHDIPARVKGLAPVRDGVRVRYKTALIADGGVNLIKYVDDPRVMRTLAREDWDVIILQDRSTAAFYQKERAEFDAALKWFKARAEEEGADLILFETWPRRTGHPFYRASPEAGFSPPRHQADMARTIRSTYARGAESVSARVAPVGTCWMQADAINDLYADDGSHASQRGADLTARVLENAISGEAGC
ncbi:MAG: hypothetical protein AAGK66_12280 [Pseudomonadota bacterium]